VPSRICTRGASGGREGESQQRSGRQREKKKENRVCQLPPVSFTKKGDGASAPPFGLGAGKKKRGTFVRQHVLPDSRIWGEGGKKAAATRIAEWARPQGGEKKKDLPDAEAYESGKTFSELHDGHGKEGKKKGKNSPFSRI